MAAVLDLINERSIEQGVDYVFLLVLPGDWRMGRFGGEIRRGYQGELLAQFSFGSPVFSGGKTSIPVMLSAAATSAIPRTTANYWVYDIEGVLSAPVRLVQGRVAVSAEATLGGHLPPASFEVDSGALLVEGMVIPRLVVEVGVGVRYWEPQIAEIVQQILGGQLEAIRTAIELHNTSPDAHLGITQGKQVVAFAFGDATPKQLGLIQGRVVTASIVVTVPFNRPCTLSVGDALDPQRLMRVEQNVPTETGDYRASAGHFYASPTQVFLTIGASSGTTQGEGFVVLEVI